MIHIRSEFPVLDRYTWLMTNARGPLSRRVARELGRMQRLLGADPIAAAIDFEAAGEAAKAATAILINARPDEIAFLGNTTTAITTIAQSLPFSAGDNVVLPAGEFPGLVYPWLSLRGRGLEVRFAPVDSIASSIDGRTRAIALSHVEWATGARRDLLEIGRLCHARGVFLIVDAAQSMGVVPIDVEAMHISALASRGDKWLLAASGIACLYVRRELQYELAPGLLGYHGMAFGEEESTRLGFSYPVELRPDAGRYELGGPNELGLVAWNAALELLLELGIDNIAQYVARLTTMAADRITELGYKLLTPTDPMQRAGIIAFQVADLTLLQEALWQEHIIVGADEFGSVIQVGPHFFNSEDDINRLCSVLAIR